MADAKTPRRGMFPLIIAWAMIGFGALSGALAFVEAPDEARTPRLCPTSSLVSGAAPASTCEPLPPAGETDDMVRRRIVGGALLVVFGALLLVARAAFIPRE